MITSGAPSSVWCACGFDRARNDHFLQLTGREVICPPASPGERCEIRACRGCFVLYAMPLALVATLPVVGEVIERTARGLVFRKVEPVTVRRGDRSYLETLPTLPPPARVEPLPSPCCGKGNESVIMRYPATVFCTLAVGHLGPHSWEIPESSAPDSNPLHRIGYGRGDDER